MSNSTFSKNLFDVLGEDDDGAQPTVPVKKEEKKAKAAVASGEANNKSRGEKKANGGNCQCSLTQLTRKMITMGREDLVSKKETKKEREGVGVERERQSRASALTTICQLSVTFREQKQLILKCLVIASPRGGARRGGRNGGRQQNGRPQRGRQFDRHSGTGIV